MVDGLDGVPSAGRLADERTVVLDGEIFVTPRGPGTHSWAVERAGGLPEGWEEAPHTARVTAVDGDRIALEDIAVGRVTEFLQRRGRLRPGEVTTIVVPLLRAAGRLGVPRADHTWLSPANAVIRSTGEAVLLPRSVPGSGSFPGDCGRLIYHLLVGRPWESAGLPLRQARADITEEMVDGVASLFSASTVVIDDLVADLARWAPPEPLTLLAAVPGEDPATAITAEIAPDSVFAALREHFAVVDAPPGQPGDGPNHDASSSRSGGLRRGPDRGSARRAENRTVRRWRPRSKHSAAPRDSEPVSLRSRRRARVGIHERRAAPDRGERRAGTASGERRAGTASGERRAGTASGERRAGTASGERRAGTASGERLRRRRGGTPRGRGMPGRMRWIMAGTLAVLLGVGGALLAIDRRCRLHSADPSCALIQLTELREQMIASGALGDLERIAVPDSPAQLRDRMVLSDMARLDIVDPPDLSVHEIRAVQLPESSEHVEALCAQARTGSFRIREGERTVEIAAREDRLLFLLHSHDGGSPGWRVSEVRTTC